MLGHLTVLILAALQAAFWRYEGHSFNKITTMTVLFLCSCYLFAKILLPLIGWLTYFFAFVTGGINYFLMNFV
jgi:hypothetical protein